MGLFLLACTCWCLARPGAAAPARVLLQQDPVGAAGALQIQVRASPAWAPAARLLIVALDASNGDAAPLASALGLLESWTYSDVVASPSPGCLGSPVTARLLGRGAIASASALCTERIYTATAVLLGGDGFARPRWLVFDARTCDDAAAVQPMCSVLADVAAASAGTMAAPQLVELALVAVQSNVTAGAGQPVTALTGQLLVTGLDGLQLPLRTQELGPEAAAVAVYAHLEHALLVALPWRSLGALGRRTISAESLQAVALAPGLPRVKVLDLRLSANNICAGSGAPVLVQRSQDGPVRLTPSGPTYYARGDTCTWVVRHDGRTRINVMVDASGMAQGAHLLISERAGATVAADGLLADYAGFSATLRQDAVSSAPTLYVTFVASGDAAPAAGPVVSVRHAGESADSNGPLIGKVIYIGSGVLIVAYIVLALIAWRQYQRIAAARREAEQQVARHALQRFAEQRAREAMHLAAQRLADDSNALPDELVEKLRATATRFERSGSLRRSLRRSSSAGTASPQNQPYLPSRVEEPEPCAVCLCTYAAGEEIVKLHRCKHVFHAACICEWMQRSRLCPLCKDDIAKSLEERSSSGSEAHDALQAAMPPR